MKDNYFFPFSNYKEMKDAYDEGKLKVTVGNRGAINNVANSKNKWFLLVFNLPFIVGSIVLFFYCKAFIGSYWLMLYSVVLLFTSSFVVFLKVRTLLIGNLVLWVLPFILNRFYWIGGIGISSFIAVIFYLIWYFNAERTTVNELLNNKQLFTDFWNNGWIELTIDNNYYYCSMGEGKIDKEI